MRTGDEFKLVYFPLSGAIAFLVEMSDGRIVASTLMGSEGAVGALSVLSPSRSPVTATAYVLGAALQVPVSQLQLALSKATRSGVFYGSISAHNCCSLTTRQLATRCIRWSAAWLDGCLRFTTTPQRAESS
ncbi:hypothetical protein [Bradyrhizobium sp. WU425]|uniref:hypothetical protein n=1 Tax=Bradyrhizobium TaxID=374 RepID=UPI002E1212D9